MDVFSNLMVIGECLLDVRRTKSFIKAIHKSVVPGCIALDVGTGSGILAMSCARAGAKKVYAIDIAPDIVHFAQGNVKKNSLDTIVTVKESDAKVFSLPKPVDVLTMELMDTWLVAEQQAVVLNQLHANNTIDSHTKLIPYRYHCTATLVHYDFSFYGLNMPFIIQARNFSVLKRIQKKISSRILVRDIDFGSKINTHVKETVSVQVQKDGLCNAIVLESKTFLAPGVTVWGTTDMNMPVIVPVPELHVKKGQQLSLSVEYTMGEGYKTFKATVSA